MNVDVAIDLTACDREPIHLPGSIQPHGMMLVADRDNLTVTHVAGPVEASALGSILAQLEIMGHLDPGDRGDVIAATARTVTFEPTE